MVRANGIKWHCFIHIIAGIPNTCLCQETFFPLSKYLPDHSAFWASNCSDVTHWSSDAFSEPWEFQSLPVSRSEAILLGCQHADMEKTWPLAFWHLDVCSACIFSFWCVVVLLMAILFWRLGSLRVPDSIDRSDESQSILWVDSQRRDSRETWGSVSF